MYRRTAFLLVSAMLALAACDEGLPTSPSSPGIAEPLQSTSTTLLASTDFSGYTVGGHPSDWAERWTTSYSGWTVRSNTSGAFSGNALLEHKTSAAKRRAVSWGKVGTPSDIRLHTRVRLSKATGGGLAGLIIAGSGSAGSESGYLWRFKTSSGGVNGIELGKYVRGSFSSIKHYPFSFKTGVLYNLILEKSGTTLRGKVWASGTSEPSGWQVQVTDTSLGSGWAGLTNYDSGTFEYDFLKAYAVSTTTSTVSSTSTEIDTIFREGFESGTLAGFHDGVDPNRHKVLTNSTLARSGSRLLQITYPAGSHGGWLTRFFMPGYDSLYVRYHVRPHSDWHGDTKMLGVRGSRIDDKWSAFGQAGLCPTGTDFFATGLVSGAPEKGGLINFYTYYPEMRREADGKCWGSWGDGTETHSSPRQLVPGRWQKIEFWIKLNSPGSKNAVQRFWIDGQLRGSWSGISVRKTTDLRLNSVLISASAKASSVTRYMYIDDLLITTGRPSS